MANFRRRKWGLRWPGGNQPRLRVVERPVDADGPSESAGMRRWRVNGYRCEVAVWPSSVVDRPHPQAIRSPGGLWIRLYWP